MLCSSTALRSDSAIVPVPAHAAAGAIVPARALTMSPVNGAFELFAVRLDVGPETVHAAAALLSEAEQQRARRFAFERERRRFTVARAALRELLAARLAMRPEMVDFVYGPHGKPALAPEFCRGDLRFNLSHSGEIAVYAFARGREIGVDVEAVRVMPDGDDIAERFFSACEYDAYRRLDARDQPLGFFNCWTRKEAFIKALGEGLSRPLASFDVSLTPGEPAQILRTGNLAGERCGWQLCSFAPLPGYIGAVVIADPVRTRTPLQPF